jgi:DNA-binding NarL/FixJ family response regulator
LVDDHAIFRDGLRFLLEAQMVDVEVVGEAANGREAIRNIQQVCPDIVILDIAMPEMNGIEAAVRIRELCSDAQIIILSMHSSSEHIFRALQAGAQAYVLKESAGEELVEAIHAVRMGRRYLSQKISDTLIDDYVRSVSRQRGIEGEQPSPLERLTAREREVLQLVVEGKSSAEIAGLLYLSPKTVETYRSRLMRKLDIEDLPTLVKFAIQHGLTSLS